MSRKSNAAVPMSEKKWRAESDARALIEAEAIKQDSTRMKAAKTAAKRMASEKEKEVKAAKKIAKK